MSRQKKWPWLCPLLSAATLASASTLGFQSAVTYPTGTAPVAVASGDFDGDGNLDLAVVNAGNSAVGDDGSVIILLGNGDGSFKAAINFSACKNCTRIAAGDSNGDSKSDLAVLRPGDATLGDNGDVTIFLSNGDGTFHKGQVLSPGKNPSSVIAPDLNADHRLDLVVTNQTDNTVAILFGNGDGTFQPPVPYVTGGQLASTLLVDFNQDGLEDLAVSPYFGGPTILLANGDGTFRSGPNFNTGSRSIAAWADFNQDGNLDYLLSGCLPLGPCSLGVALGNGDGTFQSTRSASSSDWHTIRVADYDGDGKLDIGGTNLALGQIDILLGNGDGTFQPATSFRINPNVNVAIGIVADLNHDQAPDLVTLNCCDDTISVLVNNGTDFSIAASKPTPATVSRGQSSTSTITVTLLNAFDNPVKLACSVQPAKTGGPTCSLNTTSVTPGPNGTATATLTISTGATMTDLSLSSRALLWLLVPVVGFVGIGARGSRRKRWSSVGAVLLLAASMASVSCGGSSGPRAQSYTVTVTGAAKFSQHATSVGLTIQ